MPRSFLVKSKRTHLLGQSKDSFRQQHTQSQTDAGQTVGQDKRETGDAVQPLTSALGVKDVLASNYSLWNRMAVWSHGDLAYDSRNSGNSNTVFGIEMCH